MLTIEDTLEGDVKIICPTGKLDTLTAKTFEAHLQSCVEDGNGPLLVDMSGVDYVTSFGLRSILIVAKKLAPFGRKFILFATNPSVMDVLRVSGFLKIVTVAENQDAAFDMAGLSQTASSDP
ncbi:STAS domain-containing protein [Roseibium polysiphoniae]|uniref:Anti-sigma factor antagonist n=1 Tax=Roseibium polysiphoniae TaxID=2571221 RepID=A0ABR9C9U8_9HYPH|nr:STAS domain-containing protein [Roseibium polysiphoniae]MBD8876693.1 STAS domain-containing protein [Roseibium polysiphoniae]